MTAVLRTYADRSESDLRRGCSTYSRMDSRRRLHRLRSARPRTIGSSLSLHVHEEKMTQVQVRISKFHYECSSSPIAPQSVDAHDSDLGLFVNIIAKVEVHHLFHNNIFCFDRLVQIKTIEGTSCKATSSKT